MLINDLIRMIDATYRTLVNRENRATPGLSMGSGQALQIGFGNPDRFAYIGASAGVPG